MNGIFYTKLYVNIISLDSAYNCLEKITLYYLNYTINLFMFFWSPIIKRIEIFFTFFSRLFQVTEIRKEFDYSRRIPDKNCMDSL